MEQPRRETSRVSRTSSVSRVSSGQSERPGGADQRRPSGLLSKAYNTVSFRGGGKAGQRSSHSYVHGHGAAAGADEKGDGLGTGQQDLRSFSGVFAVPEAGCEAGTAPKLTQEQEAKYQEMLAFFSAKENQELPVSLQAAAEGDGRKEPVSEWEKLRMLSRESMLRYLRATKWDVFHAKKRLIETIAWRREFGVDDLDPNEMAIEARSGKETVLGYDNMARPLHYMHPHRNDTKESPRQMQFAVWILESCIDLMPPGVEQLALLINFDHRSRNPTSIANAKLMLYILQNHYVERLGIALCINVPWVFKIFWNAIQPFIDPVTKSKCRFDEAVKSAVPLSQLSADFGGNLDPKYNHDAYFPELVKICKERREHMSYRFREQCGSKIGASEYIIRGGDDPSSPFNATVGNGSSHESKPEDVVKSAQSAATSTDKSSIMTSVGAAPVKERDTEAATAAAAAAAAASPRMENSSAIERFTTAGESAEGVSSPSHRIDSRSVEHFKTPSETPSKTPLDRQFSNISKVPETSSSTTLTAAGTAVSDGSTPTVIDGEKDTPEQVAAVKAIEKHKKRGSSQPSSNRNSGIAHGWAQFEGGVTRGFKDMEHKIQKSKMFTDINAAFHPSSRRGSRDQQRGGSSADQSKGNTAPESTSSAASPAQNGASTSAVAGAGEPNTQRPAQPSEAETKVETPATKEVAQLPSAAEAVALAGSAGCTTAATAIGTVVAEQAGQQLQRAKSQAGELLMSPRTEGDGPALNGSNDQVQGGLVAVALPDSDGKETLPKAPKTVTMLFFAAAKDAVGGKGRHEIALPSDMPAAGLPLIELTARLLASPPPGCDVAALKRVLLQSKWSVDEEMIDDEEVGNTILRGGEDVAIIPPVSGG